MKLLIIYHSGLADDVKYIFREYVKQGVNLTVVVPLKSGSLIYNTKHNEEKFKYVPLKLKAAFNFFSLFLAIKKIKPDVIHVMDEYTNFSLFQTIICRNILHVLYGKKIPIFSFSFINLPLESLPLSFKSPVVLFRRVIQKFLFPFILYYHKRNLNGIVGGNKESLEIIKNLGAKAPAKLIFWGVNINLFFPKNRDKSREKLGIPQNIKLIGYFGRIIEEKGLDTLVLAVNKINDCHLIFVGDGDYKNTLTKIIDSLDIKNRTFFYKSVNHADLVDFYSALDVFILPSKTMPQWEEQYGRVLVEAMACGLPVIGSSSGAIPTVLEGYPKGLIFKEGDVDNLVEKIKEVEKLKFPESFSTNKFLYKFSIENFVSENIKFYKELLK